MRGFLSGLIWGLVVVVVGIAGLSLLSPVAPRPEVTVEAPQTVSEAPIPTESSGVAPTKGDADLVEAQPAAPSPGEGTPADQSPTAVIDTDPAVQPQVTAGTEEMAAPAESSSQAGVASEAEATAVQVAAPTETPQAPAQDSDLADSVDPAQPSAPVVADATTGLNTAATEAETAPKLELATEVAPDNGDPTAPAAATAAGSTPTASTESAAAPAPAPTPVVVPQPTAGNAPDAQTPATQPAPASQPQPAPAQIAAADINPAAETAPAPTPAPKPDPEPAPEPTAEPAPEPTPEPAPETAATAPEQPAEQIVETPAEQPEPAPAQQPAADPVQQPTAEPAMEPAQETDQQPVQRPQVAALPQAGSSDTELRPTIGKPVKPLTERVPAAATEPAEATEATEATEAAVAEPAADGPPIVRYAQPFANPDDKPMMAVVLIDDAASIGVEALQDFPYPLTFALDPVAPGAAEKMARHRAAGFEVVALVDLPTAAAAQDAEVLLSAGMAELTDAVAVLEGTGTGIQGSRGLSDQVTDFVGSTGLGLITQDNGLNTVQKLAQRDGVPSAVVFRDFDGAGQKPTVMRRFLDQAAFRAGQDGTVIMLGRVRPDTISALLLWGLQDRASRVILAPVSAVLSASVTAR